MGVWAMRGPNQKRQIMAGKANEKRNIKDWSEANFAVKPKCKRCGVEMGFGEQRASMDDHNGKTLCQPCIKLGISLGKLDDPMTGNPLKNW